MKKASTAAVENAEDKAKRKYPGTVTAMKPTACKDSQGLPLEAKPGNISKHAQPTSLSLNMGLSTGPAVLQSGRAAGWKRKAAMGSSLS